MERVRDHGADPLALEALGAAPKKAVDGVDRLHSYQPLLAASLVKENFKVFKRISLGLVLILAAMLIVAPIAQAKKPVHVTATLAVSPNPIAAGAEYAITGCGYAANSSVKFLVTSPGGVAFWGGIVGSDGCLTAGNAGWATATPGTATIEARDVVTDAILSVATFQIV